MAVLVRGAGNFTDSDLGALHGFFVVVHNGYSQSGALGGKGLVTAGGRMAGSVNALNHEVILRSGHKQGSIQNHLMSFY